MSNVRATAFNNVWSFLGGSLGFQGHEKALKTALYNALAMLLLAICCAAAYALYFILDPFIKPLIWAMLLGSVLHPFKYSMVYSVKNWLDFIESRRIPFPVALLMIPVNALDQLSNHIGDFIYNHLKVLFYVGVTVPLLFFLYGYTPQTCICLLWRVIFVLFSVINFFVGSISTTFLATFIFGYLALLTFWWHPDLTIYFSVLGYCMLNVAAGFFSHLCGPTYQVAAFMVFQAVYLFGYMYEKWVSNNSFNTSQERHLSLVEAIVKTATSGNKSTDVKSEHLAPISSNDTKTENEDDCSSTNNELSDVDNPLGVSGPQFNKEQITSSSSKQVPLRFPSLPNTSTFSPLALATFDSHLKLQESHAVRPTALKSIPSEADNITSDGCLYVLGWTCLAVFIWNHIWLLHFLPVTILVYIFKHVGHYFGLWKWSYEQLCSLQVFLTEWFSMRHDAICPSFVSGLFKIQNLLRLKLLHALRDSIDTAASVLVILALLVFVLCTTIFISVNVYAEGIYIVQMAGNAINSTLSNNQELLALLPEGVQEKMHLVLDNAYLYGRQSISNMAHAMLKNADADKAEELEQRVLELWDRIYQAWMMTSTEIPGSIGPKVSSSAVYASWESFVDGIQKTPELLNLEGIIQFAKENVGMLSSLLESLWDILKGNVSLLFQSSLTIFSVVLGGGSAVINFLINSVVLFTALFYLLSSSGSVYRPVELVASFSPSSGNQIAIAIDGAVGDVFRASFKMAVFHGLWAWLIHTLFAVKVVYLPSVLAAILGVVPFLGTYWACIPAALELWVVHGYSMMAVLMVLAFYIPTSWVNGLIYEEIKGGHPYLTGLSVAGGVYCMGSEGAIFGPLLLCCVLVALNISSTLMKEPSLSHLSPMLRHMPPLRRRDTIGGM